MRNLPDEKRGCSSLKQKQILSLFGVTFLFTIIFVLLGCESFPTQYERIDSDKVRLLDITYSPIEIAPGDTVTVKAIFSGKKTLPGNLHWSVSHNVLMNTYGVDTAFDIKPLEATLIPFVLSSQTYGYSFKMVIPPTAIYSSVMVPEDWTRYARENGIPFDSIINIPQFKSKRFVLSVLDSMASRVNGWTVAMASGQVAIDSLLQFDPYFAIYSSYLKGNFPVFLQLFSVPMRLFCSIDGEYSIRSTFHARLNKRFYSLPGARIYINTNPVIDSVGVYKVEGSNKLFFKSTDNYTFTKLPFFHDSVSRADSVPTIVVESGYTYFIAGFISNIDSTLTLEAAASGKPAILERNELRWFFAHPQSELTGVSAYDLMNIGGEGGSQPALLYPPKNHSVKSFTIWCKAQDFVYGEIFRPRGSSCQEVRGKFEYR